MTSANQSIEYLLSRYLLKQLLAKGLINEEEFRLVDVEDRRTFGQ